MGVKTSRTLFLRGNSSEYHKHRTTNLKICNYKTNNTNPSKFIPEWTRELLKGKQFCFTSVTCQSVFPDKLKKAQVTPLYKKNDPLLKTNYRPVSVLCIFSKIFEKILEQQLSDFFENIFNPYLCAFRRGHGCQTTLLRLLED